MESPALIQHVGFGPVRVGLVLGEIFVKVVSGHTRVSNALTLRFLGPARQKHDQTAQKLYACVALHPYSMRDLVCCAWVRLCVRYPREQFGWGSSSIGGHARFLRAARQKRS